MSKQNLNCTSYHFASKLWTTIFVNLGFIYATNLDGKGHIRLELSYMSITSIIRMTHKNILKPLPRYGLVIIGIHLQKTKLQLWNTTTIALPLYAWLVILIMFKFGIENQVTHGPYSKKRWSRGATMPFICVATLALGSRPRRRFARERAKRSVRECEYEDSHSQVSSHFGSWSPSGLPNLHRAIAEGKTLCIEKQFISLEIYWSVDV